MSGDHEGAPAPAQPFRFKDSSGRKDESSTDGDAHKPRRHRHHSRRSRRTEESDRHRFKRRRRDVDRDANHTQALNPDDAFRESLFDAMGDDEGANFWEGVYGQPIHNYPNQFMNEDTGELETMDDEEYAQYVRRKMWEKSREGVEAAREEHRKEKARRKAQEEQEEAEQRRARKKSRPNPTHGPHNNFVFDFEIEASLRRGQRRKDHKRWRELWQNYLKRWDELQEFAKTRDSDAPTTNLFLRNKIAWPVESRQRKDVNSEEIGRFLRTVVEAKESEDADKDSALATILKAERIRWHPDKIQQRYGFMEIDETTMKAVTATFQVLDTMWNDLRSHKD